MNNKNILGHNFYVNDQYSESYICSKCGIQIFNFYTYKKIYTYDKCSFGTVLELTCDEQIIKNIIE